MFGQTLAPSETVPLLESFRWRKGEKNPASTFVDIIEDINTTQFSCPTCHSPIFCEHSKIADDVGANVVCGLCGNISHVPSTLKDRNGLSQALVYGCVFVPISEFGEWYDSHPVFETLLHNRESEILHSYGLWAFCAKCKHQYKSSVLAVFPLFKATQGGFFNANTQESAKDMKSLMDGHCSSCGDSNLIAVIVDIPQHMREVLPPAKLHH